MSERKFKRVFGYARVSSIEQTIGSSLEHQQDAIRAYARSLGLTVTQMFVEAESGIHEKIERRQKIQALMAEVRAGDLVLCHVLDRWSRDPEFTYASMRQILERGGSFYAIQDRIDPSTPDGDSAMGLRILVAHEEHKRIKQRLVGTRMALRDRGYVADGLLPMGYQRKRVKGPKKNVPLIEPEGAAKVRTIFRLCIEGKSISDTVDLLGVHRDLVGDTLRNRLYLGEVRDSRGHWIKARHEPIIDAATFAMARESVERRRKGERRARTESQTSTWWLRDLARCARCGSKMSAVYGPARPDGHRNYYYRCFYRCTSRMVPVRPIELEAEPIVVARLTALHAELVAATPTNGRAPVDVAKRLAQLEAKRARLIDAFADGHFDRAELRRRLDALDNERTRAEAAAGGIRPPTTEERRAALGEIGRMARCFGKALPQERRLIAGALARSVALVLGKPPRFEWIGAEDLARAKGPVE